MDAIDELTKSLRKFVEERQWDAFHDPKNLAMAVVSEAGELAAELRWVPQSDADSWCREPDNRQRVADEIGDVALCLLMLADRIDLDLAQAMRDKLEKNRLKYPVETAKGRFE
jgi:dCTP diphosphatase